MTRTMLLMAGAAVALSIAAPAEAGLFTGEGSIRLHTSQDTIAFGADRLPLGQPSSISTFQIEEGGIFSDSTTFEFDGDAGSATTGGFVDPRLATSFSFTDADPPSSIAAIFEVPIDPITRKVRYIAAASATSASIPAGTFDTISAEDTFVSYLFGTGAGLDLVDFALPGPFDVGGGPVGIGDVVGGMFDCGAFVGGCTSMITVISFMGPGGNIPVGFTTDFIVPEPASLALFGFGALGLGLYGRRARRA